MTTRHRIESVAIAIAACIALVAASIGCSGPTDPTPQSSSGAPGPISLTILHTNDVAGEIDPCG